MKMSITPLAQEISQVALTYGERLISTIQKNKIVIVALLALGCLAAYLCKRINNHQSAQLAAKTPHRIDTGRLETSPLAQTQNVFEQAISKEEKLQETESVLLQKKEEENRKPSPNSKENETEICDADDGKMAFQYISEQTLNPIEDPVEIQKKLEEPQEERRKLIVDAVQKAESITELEQFMDNEEDLIDVLNAAIGFRAEKILKTKSNGCFIDGTEGFLNPLFSPYSQLYVDIQQKFGGDLVGIAARDVKGHLNRLYLACVLKVCRRSIVDTSSTKDEIVEFLEEIDTVDKLTYGDQPGYEAFDVAGSYINGTVFHSIAQFDSAKDERDYRSDEWNTKRLAVFKEFYAKSHQAVTDAFKSAIRYHDRDLLQAVFDVGYRDPVLPLTTDDFLFDRDELEEHKRDVRREEERQRVGQLLNELRANSSSRDYCEYGDYYRLRETIELLIEKRFLKLEDFLCDKRAETTHQLIMSEYFAPTDYVLINMLESSQCDLPTLNEMMERETRFDSTFDTLIFDTIMRRAVWGIPSSLRACQFLHDHYSELEHKVKKNLALVLKQPKYQTVKHKYFDDLGI